MRRFKTALLASAIAACAFAAPAMAAHQFEGPGAPAEASATGDGAQTFVFKPFRVTCETAKSATTGLATPWPAETLALQMSYGGCKAHVGKIGKSEGPAIPTKFLSAVALTYHANGYVEVGAMELAIGGLFKCHVETEAKIFPLKAEKHPTEEFNAATFTDEPVTTKSKKLPIQQQVVVHNAEIKGVHYELSEGFCEELEMTEGKNGSYSGALKAQVKKTNLSWK